MRRRPLLVSVVLTASVLALPAGARAAWGPPVAISPAGQDVSAAALAVDDGGRPAVLLEARGRGAATTLRLRRGTARGGLTAPATVTSSPHIIESAMLFTGRGSDLVAGWLDIVNGARRPVVATGSRLADRQVLAPGPRSTQFLALAADRRGDAAVAFWRYSGNVYSVWAAYRLAGGRFGAAQQLAVGRVGNPVVAVGPGGEAVVAWGTPEGLQVAERTAGATAFATPSQLPTASSPLSEPGVGIAGGHVVLAWVTGTAGGGRSLVAAESAAAGSPPAAPVAIDPGASSLPPRPGAPTVTVQPGRSLVAWVRGPRGSTARDTGALAVSTTPGTWGAVQRLAAPGRAHAGAADLTAPAPGRPPILALTTQQGARSGVATANLRADGTLGPRRVPVAGPVRPGARVAQGGGRAWLAATREVGTTRHPSGRALLLSDA
ncbi:hypothetical protein FSW04_22095 [Baekduia soli]|uniref:Uncharacterized protein n=1 Tax=Baekduia soli TaxID=496014 RepID=A0A5B8U9Y5_9ACTN|nr:hypothetical protein [Baekduia soli]QEC49993.1 hypothetical protein FSW04_22095 [Baekduia soli]